MQDFGWEYLFLFMTFISLFIFVFDRGRRYNEENRGLRGCSEGVFKWGRTWTEAGYSRSNFEEDNDFKEEAGLEREDQWPCQNNISRMKRSVLITCGWKLFNYGTYYASGDCEQHCCNQKSRRFNKLWGRQIGQKAYRCNCKSLWWDHFRQTSWPIYRGPHSRGCGHKP